MKRTILAVILIAVLAGLAAAGCATECPGFYREEEEGYVRCGVENPHDDAQDWISIKCSTVARDGDGYPINANGERIINGYPVDEDGHYILGGDGVPVRGENPRCCVSSAELEKRECMKAEPCDERLADIPGRTNMMECDENSDCELLYGAKPDPMDRKVICCAAYKEGITECRLPEDCVYDGETLYTGCLSTWQCLPPQECIKNIYIEDIYYCKDPADM